MVSTVPLRLDGFPQDTSNVPQRLLGGVILGLLVPAITSAQTVRAAQSFEQLRVLVGPGDTIVVTDRAGRDTTGRIALLLPGILELVVDGDTRTIREPDVRRIRHRRPDSLANGALWGLGVGAGWAALIVAGAAADDHDTGGPDAIAGFVATLGGLGAAIGVGIDALIRTRQVVYENPTAARRTIIWSPQVGRSGLGACLTVRF